MMVQVTAKRVASAPCVHSGARLGITEAFGQTREAVTTQSRYGFSVSPPTHTRGAKGHCAIVRSAAFGLMVQVTAKRVASAPCVH